MFKKTNASIFSGLRQLRRLVTVNPAVEKSLSLTAEVAGTYRIDLATLANVLNLNSFSFHHSKGFVSLTATFSAKYWLTSLSQLVSDDSSSSPRRISMAVTVFSSYTAVKLQQNV